MPKALSTVSAMSYSMPRPSVKKRTNVSVSRKSNKISLVSFLTFLLLIGTFVFYLYLNVQLVEANFDLKDIEKNLEKTEIENQKLEAQIGESVSMQKLQVVAQESKLERAKDVRFVEVAKPGNLSLER